MTDNNNPTDNNQKDCSCMICHRREADIGPLIHMPGNVCICQDCFQKSMDEAMKWIGGDLSK